MARRLVIVMLAVLAISTFGATLLAPPAEEPQQTSSTEDAQTAPAGASAPSGRLIEASVQADARRAEPIRLRAGDQLELTVRSRIAGQVEIARFGMLEDVGPSDPARFSLLVAEASRFEVRVAGSARTITVIEVAVPRRDRPTPEREADRAHR